MSEAIIALAIKLPLADDQKTAMLLRFSFAFVSQLSRTSGVKEYELCLETVRVSPLVCSALCMLSAAWNLEDLGAMGSD